MRLARNRKGQFIIIAAILLSIMIISVSTVIYGTVTYYRQERWEEYVTVVDSIKESSCNLLQVGLSNYTQTLDPNVMSDYFKRWVRDVRNAYPAFGIDLGYALANRPYSAYGVNLNYNLGLARDWGSLTRYLATSYSASNATVSIDVASVGLTGYNFSSHVFLKMSILKATYYSGSKYLLIHVSVDKEGLEPVISLQASNFGVTIPGATPSFTVRRYFSPPPPDGYNRFIYEIKASTVDSPPSSVEVMLVDSRGIKTVSSTFYILQNTG